MRAGSLRQSITIQRRTVASVGTRGEPNKSWATLATVGASVETLDGRKLELARQVAPTATYRVTLRYLDGLTTADQIVWGSLTLSISKIIDPDNRHRELQVYCSEVGGQ